MRLFSVRLAAIVGLLVMMELFQSSPISSVQAATHAVPQSSSQSRLLGKQAHTRSSRGATWSTTGAGGQTPQTTVYCDIYDDTQVDQVNRRIGLQVTVTCPDLANITITDYIDTCTLWNYGGQYCDGQWVRGGGVTCTKSGTVILACTSPNPLWVAIARGKTVRAVYEVTTDIPGTTGPDTNTYYSGPYQF